MNKLAIVGGAPSSEMDAPFGQEGYDIWVLANRLKRYDPKHINLAFELHKGLACYPEGYRKHIESFNVKTIWPEDYPFNDIEQEFGDIYLTSSIAYMFAYAIFTGFKHIELYGVDMAVDDHEYYYQKPCLEYWIGYARGRWIEVVLPDNCPLCKSTFLYGVDDHNTVPDMINVNEYTDMAKQHRDKQQEALQALQNAGGIEWFLKVISLSNAHSGAAEAYERVAMVRRAQEAGQDVKSIKDNVLIR